MSYFSPLFISPQTFSGYITVVDFIHFFQMKKNLLLALVWDPFIDNGAFCSGLGRKWESEGGALLR